MSGDYVDLLFFYFTIHNSLCGEFTELFFIIYNSLGGEFTKL